MMTERCVPTKEEVESLLEGPPLRPFGFSQGLP